MLEDDLTAQEQQALDGLPREARPSGLLEERTVRMLQNRGLLIRRARGVSAMGAPRYVAAAAAVVVLVLGSFWLGRWSGRPLPEAVPTSVQDRDLRLAAREVQRTGSEYVLALDAFTRARRGDPRDFDQGREVALVTLRAAANRVSNLTPEFRADGGPREGPQDARLIWF